MQKAAEQSAAFFMFNVPFFLFGPKTHMSY